MPEAGHILIADDDKVSLSLTAGLLEKHGYTCTCVVDGTSAQERLRNIRYDLVISDIKMPGNFDFDLIKVLAQPTLDVPVILVTAYPSLHSALQSIQLSVAGYLVKPFAPDELFTQVRTAIANKRAEKALRESEERYRNLFDNASDALVTVTLDGTITRVNRSFALLLGYDPQESHALEDLLGQPYHTFIAPASIPRAKQEALPPCPESERSSTDV